MDNTGNYPGGSTPYNAPPSNKKLQQTQAQVDEVVGIMRSNVAKVLERDEKLSELHHRADNLQVGASQFEQQASRLKRKYWWQNLKMMIIIGVICAVLLIIIFVSIFSGGGGDSDKTTPSTVASAPAVNPAPASGP